MNRLVKSITLVILLLFAMDAAAADNCIILNLNQENFDSEPEKEAPNTKGPRSMPTPIKCIIDFGEGTVRTTLTSEIISYEIWDSAGTTPVAQCMDDSDFVVLLSSISGFYQLRLATESHQYIGYIELSER